MRVLLIGLPAAGRLESVQHVLRDLRDDVEFEATPSISALQSSGASAGPLVALILVFQDWPEQYTSGEADWLLSNHPTPRILCVYGGFCESDGRTRNIWPHAVRVPQWGLRNRLRRELPADGLAPRLPLTASRRERFLFEYPPQLVNRVIPDCTIRIVTPDRTLAAGLASMLDLPQQPLTPPDVILFDVDPWTSETQQELKGLATHYPRARLIALAGFPGHIPVDEISAAGAACVLPKLLSADELVNALHSSRSRENG